MKISDIEVFFKDLSNRIPFRIQVILIGGAAATLFGGTRATQDIDFEVHLKPKHKRIEDYLDKLQTALEETHQKTGIRPEYSEDFDRWSMITLPYRKSTLYKRIGKIEIRLLDPALWSIGKLERFLDSDIQDLKFVLKKQWKKDPGTLVKIWGKALKKSPPSSQQFSFKKQVTQFITDHAKEIWGQKVRPDDLINTFQSSAQKTIKTKKK